jgi:hypothetical protein
MKIGDKVVCIKESGRFVLNERAEISYILENRGDLSNIFFIHCHNTSKLGSGFPFRTENFLEHFMSLEDWREKQLEQIICISE